MEHAWHAAREIQYDTRGGYAILYAVLVVLYAVLVVHVCVYVRGAGLAGPAQVACRRRRVTGVDETRQRRRRAQEEYRAIIIYNILQQTGLANVIQPVTAT